MSKVRIFSIFISVELAIIGTCIWLAFHRFPLRDFIIPAALLFSVNGLWLIWMTLRHTPPRD